MLFLTLDEALALHAHQIAQQYQRRLLAHRGAVGHQLRALDVEKMRQPFTSILMLF